MLKAAKMCFNCTVQGKTCTCFKKHSFVCSCVCVSMKTLASNSALSNQETAFYLLSHQSRYATVSISTALSFEQSSVVDVLVFSHSSAADVSCLPWESISDVGCVVQACSDGKTRIRGAWSCRQVTRTHTHPGHCWRPHWNNSSVGVAEKACSRESSKANEGMLSTYQRLVERLIGRIVSLSRQRWGPFMLQMICFLYLFDTIHIVIAAW